MTRFTVAIPNGTTSKTDEIETLKKLTDKFAGTGSYLESLFTPELFDWAEQQIMVDFPPNVFDHWTADHDNALKTIDRLRAEERGWTNQIDQLEQSLEDHSAAIENQKLQAIALSKESNERLEEIEALKTEHVRLQAHNWELFQETRQLQTARNEQSDEIVALKARLFDYMLEDRLNEQEIEKPWDKSQRLLNTDLTSEVMTDEQLEKIRAQRSTDEHVFTDEPKNDYEHDDKYYGHA